MPQLLQRRQYKSVFTDEDGAEVFGARLAVRATIPNKGRSGRLHITVRMKEDKVTFATAYKHSPPAPAGRL